MENTKEYRTVESQAAAKTETDKIVNEIVAILVRENLNVSSAESILRIAREKIMSSKVSL